MGTLARMGPGWFPMALGTILELFGVYLMARGIGWPEKSPGPLIWGWRAPVCIVASMLAFAAGVFVRLLKRRPDDPEGNLGEAKRLPEIAVDVA